MMSVGQVAIDQAFERLVRLVGQYRPGFAEGWRLVPGSSNTPRTPWRIETSSGRAVMTVGYTRRQVLDALQSMDAILATILEG